jgi:hypothetical protein
LRGAIQLRYAWLFGKLTAPLGLLAAALVGCSLSDYEKQMEYQQQRVDYMERLDKAVTPEPIAWPEPKVDPKATSAEKKAMAWMEPIRPNEIFFRLPSGFLTSPDQTPEAKIFQRFKTKDKNSPYKEILVAAMRTADEKKFQDDVRARLRIKSSELKPKPGVGKESGRPIDFQECYDERPGSPIVYLRSDESIHVAIVYRPAADATDTALGQMAEKIDYSLATLALGSQASKRARPGQK